MSKTQTVSPCDMKGVSVLGAVQNKHFCWDPVTLGLLKTKPFLLENFSLPKHLELNLSVI